MRVPSPDALVQEQIAYYQAFAEESSGNPGHSTAAGPGNALVERWQQEQQQVLSALDEFNITGRVLEIAGGTGTFTAILARQAGTLTVVDSSAAALEENRRRVPLSGIDVKYIVANIFDWAPAQRYDTVFFAFWLSHVPIRLFPRFWSMLRNAVRPGGQVCFLDNAPTPEVVVREAGGGTGAKADGGPSPVVLDLPHEDVSLRKLRDGRRFWVVKHFWQPRDLADRLLGLGWDAEVHVAGTTLLCGTAKPVPTAPATE